MRNVAMICGLKCLRRKIVSNTQDADIKRDLYQLM